MANKPTYEELEQKIQALEFLEAKHESEIELNRLFHLSIDTVCFYNLLAKDGHFNCF